jgi:thioredoxin 2
MSNAQLDIKGIVVSCSSCGQKNRLHYNQLGRESRCGKCQTAIVPPGEAIEASDSTAFQALLANSTLPILVDFWAEWCGPCKMAAPEVAKAAGIGAGKLVTVKVNTETLPDISQRYGINSIPTFILFANGAEKNRIQGARSAADLIRFAGV